jgi:hypothetical protein
MDNSFNLPLNLFSKGLPQELAAQIQNISEVGLFPDCSNPDLNSASAQPFDAVSAEKVRTANAFAVLNGLDIQGRSKLIFDKEMRDRVLSAVTQSAALHNTANRLKQLQTSGNFPVSFEKATPVPLTFKKNVDASAKAELEEEAAKLFLVYKRDLLEKIIVSTTRQASNLEPKHLFQVLGQEISNRLSLCPPAWKSDQTLLEVLGYDLGVFKEQTTEFFQAKLREGEESTRKPKLPADEKDKKILELTRDIATLKTQVQNLLKGKNGKQVPTKGVQKPPLQNRNKNRSTPAQTAKGPKVPKSAKKDQKLNPSKASFNKNP